MTRVPDHRRQQELSHRAEFVVKRYLTDHPDETLRRKVTAGAVTMAEAYHLLKDLARDPKTGVPRADLLTYALEYELDRADQTGHPLTIGIFDIDHFKVINTELTHVGADDILRLVANLIGAAVRVSDDVLEPDDHDQSVIRWGGEEFIVIFSGTSLAQARVAAERLRQSVAESLRDRRPNNQLVTVSGGLGQYQPDTIADWRDLLRRADEQLLAAKAAGRNRIFPLD